MDGPVFDAMLKTALMEALEEDLKDLDTVPAKRPLCPDFGSWGGTCQPGTVRKETAAGPLAVGGGDCGHPGRHSGQLCASGRRIFPSDV